MSLLMNKNAVSGLYRFVSIDKVLIRIGKPPALPGRLSKV
jgi:hypothetical protein